ncbi:outer membrane receptor protein involved in Fe transport [Nonlabens xylanidelens]|uniref:Outer membrane receptor protein involved in Fe transport n=1 Tax=Nonlabens xylanidelens TaxID=191564 RepID=A0A2S6IQP1_9FLAO|nr:TonB-dependent receptor [Nonlabens xylanidelens]PPK96426.1 outer membrane receptor protein involved in Fe transport [Nonlabens xylanidelens]PQJ18242.1 TonB-dependent receptor [Nonlabens xylanidelens]
MNFKKIIILLVLLIGYFSNAQTLFKGKVIDSNNTPLEGVTIISKTTSKGATTDANGDFEINLKDSRIVLISYLGYTSKTVTLQSSFNEITLVEESLFLDGVVISASREAQKRSEVPAAIVSINAKEIKETKAISIDQITNQVPGVFVATSKASSNEQHFTAVRSPISTRALFLYLQDGIPLRPVAVFNHNALLELNNLSFERVEILKGPASSIYGSEAIGGSFNFLTKKPTRDLTGSASFEANDLGLTRYGVEVSKYTNPNFGFYLGTNYAKRKNGPLGHSDYEKFALTFKGVLHFNSTTKWTNSLDLIDYRSDMAGSISEEDFFAENFESDQTFTERDALVLRIKSTLEKRWNSNNKTEFNLLFRDNNQDQIPSFRVRQFRDQGQLTGFGSGEVNTNNFKSFLGLVQHKAKFNFLNSSLIAGASVDFSPQDYQATTTNVIVDPLTGINQSQTINTGDFILNYEADILNYAAYFQYEISPINNLKITAAARFDQFEYDYDNRTEGIAGANDAKVTYTNFAPKIGFNYNFTSKIGAYGNFSTGFTPPQSSNLFRGEVTSNGDIEDLEPSNYLNYEIGGYLTSEKLKLDVSAYLLDGEKTLISLRDDEGRLFNTNAGKTSSYGIEYGITYKILPSLEIRHSGSYAKHRYVEFFENGVDFSDTDRETAPNLLGQTTLTYKPTFVKGLRLSLDYESVGEYNTSFEGQVVTTANDGTETTSTNTYDGHDVFNIGVSYEYKKFEIWGQALNIFDELYAARASFNSFSASNTFTIGNPLAFHGGIRYNF